MTDLLGRLEDTATGDSLPFVTLQSSTGYLAVTAADGSFAVFNAFVGLRIKAFITGDFHPEYRVTDADMSNGSLVFGVDLPASMPPPGGSPSTVVDSPPPAGIVGLGGGDMISLFCMGNIPGPAWLDGRTADGSVGLAPNLSPPFTGAGWFVMSGFNNELFLACLGSISGPRWIDGLTASGGVRLAPGAGYEFNAPSPASSGARWKVIDRGDGSIALECQGQIAGPRLLDGRTADGTVGLASNSGLSGTSWRVRKHGAWPPPEHR
jgi:hypothetical protein